MEAKRPPAGRPKAMKRPPKENDEMPFIQRGHGQKVCDDLSCEACGRDPILLKCDHTDADGVPDCGRWGHVVNCGHYQQPRPLAASESGRDILCEEHA